MTAYRIQERLSKKEISQTLATHYENRGPHPWYTTNFLVEVHQVCCAIVSLVGKWSSFDSECAREFERNFIPDFIQVFVFIYFKMLRDEFRCCFHSSS